jgi:hypothetical protein
VHARDNDNGVWIHAIENDVWEALEQEAPCITEDDRLTKRMSANFTQSGVDRLEELLAQTGPLPLIPGKGFFDVRCGGGPKDQVHYLG